MLPHPTRCSALTVAALRRAVAGCGERPLPPPGRLTESARSLRDPEDDENEVPASARWPALSGQHAAVALIFAGADGALSLCFIQRATHPRDPWSGQMALPGGRAAVADRSLRDTAVRETYEEVGLRLDRYEYLGAGTVIPLVRQGRPLAGTVAPFVFYAGSELPSLALEPREVTAGYWIAVDYLCAPRNHVTLERVADGGTRRPPAIRFGRQLIWGMTYRMVTGLLDRTSR